MASHVNQTNTCSAIVLIMRCLAICALQYTELKNKVDELSYTDNLKFKIRFIDPFGYTIKFRSWLTSNLSTQLLKRWGDTCDVNQLINFIVQPKWLTALFKFIS